MTFIYCFFQNKTTGKYKNIGMYMTSTIWLSPFHLNLHGHCCKPQLPSEFVLHIQHSSCPFYISAKVAWNCYAKLQILAEIVKEQIYWKQYDIFMMYLIFTNYDCKKYSIMLRNINQAQGQIPFFPQLELKFDKQATHSHWSK